MKQGEWNGYLMKMDLMVRRPTAPAAHQHAAGAAPRLGRHTGSSGSLRIRIRIRIRIQSVCTLREMELPMEVTHVNQPTVSLMPTALRAVGRSVLSRFATPTHCACVPPNVDVICGPLDLQVFVPHRPSAYQLCAGSLGIRCRVRGP